MTAQLAFDLPTQAEPALNPTTRLAWQAILDYEADHYSVPWMLWDALHYSRLDGLLGRHAGGAFIKELSEGKWIIECSNRRSNDPKARGSRRLTWRLA